MSNRTDAARPLVLHILKKCIERIEALDLKGKKADEAALHFMTGAASATSDDPVVYNWLVTLVVMIVNVRGANGVREAISSIEKAA